LPLSPSKTVTASLSTQATITLWVYRSVEGVPQRPADPCHLPSLPGLAAPARHLVGLEPGLAFAYCYVFLGGGFVPRCCGGVGRLGLDELDGSVEYDVCRLWT
jgi:hypothetical protein